FAHCFQLDLGDEVLTGTFGELDRIKIRDICDPLLLRNDFYAFRVTHPRPLSYSSIRWLETVTM
ncbi:MAG: hypothetical protein WAT91_09855, partial [Saprospiraceae bacterium]